MEKDIVHINISGLGIILYSRFAVLHISDDEDYFTMNYQSPEQVLAHIYKGTIVGFCTSSPGNYILKFFRGYPDDVFLASNEFKLRLGIHVKEGKIFIRDLYDLMAWSSECPENQSIEVDDGFYHVTLCSNVPDSGVLGDNQVVFVYLKKLDAMPKLYFKGVPTLCS